MSKLEKAISTSRTALGEYGLSERASSAAKIFRSGSTQILRPDLRAEIASIERAVPSDVLIRVRAKNNR